MLEKFGYKIDYYIDMSIENYQIRPFTFSLMSIAPATFSIVILDIKENEKSEGRARYAFRKRKPFL